MPDEVLGLIYAQTVVWVGSFFCPLLPLLNLAKFLLLFYMKKVRAWESIWVLREKRPKNQFALVGRARALEWLPGPECHIPPSPQLTLFSTCSPASRTFRASAANFFFPLVLLLGLALSAVPVLYSIFL